MRALAILLLAGCAVSAERSALPMAARPDAVDWHVHVDTRGKSLGAYTLVLRYSADVAVIERIEPCRVSRFRGSPEYDPASFGAGMTRVASLDTHPLRPPDEEYHLLTVTFRRAGPGLLRARAEIEKLYDGDNKAIAGQITLPQFEHSFR